MIFFIDTEHESGYLTKHGDWLLAARTRVKYRLEDLFDDEVLVVRYDRLSLSLVEQYGATSLFFSGSSSVPTDYPSGSQESMFEAIRNAPVPMFGFCGGHQVIGKAFGAPLEPLGAIPDGEVDPDPSRHPGFRKEYGYFGIPLTAQHPVLDGLSAAPVMRHAHTWELTALPDGFTTVASTDVTPIQMMVNDERQIVGTQFHPEYWTDEHPDGRLMIENFGRWAGLI